MIGTDQGSADWGAARLRGRAKAVPVALALCACVVLLLAPAAHASKAVVGTLKTLPGEFSRPEAPKGLAVNDAGVGGVGVGEIYVVNAPNNRVEAFSPAGAFTRAFGYDVTAAGPDNTGANEKESLSVDATGGSLTLTTATGATGFGDITADSNVITNVSTATGAFHVGDGIEGCGILGGTTIAAVGSGSLTLSANANSFFCPPHRALTAFETTAPIPFNATAAELEAALAALPGVGAGSIAVNGGPGASAPLTVELKGAFSHNDVPQMTADSSGLSGGAQTATVATLTPGGGNEVCSPLVNPSDVCKAGSASAAAGGLAEPTGIAIDQSNGNVYVTDADGGQSAPNYRVAVYSATGGFEGAFGWHVDASDPQEELQLCTIATGCQAGTPGGGAGQLGDNEIDLPAVDPGNGHLYLPDGGNARVQELAPTLNGASEVTGVSFVKAFGWNVVRSGPDQSSEIQQIRILATAGKFTLSFGANTTGELEFNVPASGGVGPTASMENALNALPSISAGGGSVKVTGGPGDKKGTAPYAISFAGGPLAHADVVEIVAHKGTLSGGVPSPGGVEVETYANGTEGLESCVAARGDVCQSGVTGGRMGQFTGLPGIQSPTSVAVDASGTVYVVDEQGSNCDPEPVFGLDPTFRPCRVYKFTFPAEGEVAASEFAPAFLTHTKGEQGNAVGATDVAVDPADNNVLVAKSEGEENVKFLEFDSSGALLDESPGEGGSLKTGSISFSHGLAIGPGGRFYFSDPRGLVDVFGQPPAPTVSISPVTAPGTTTATFHGTVTPPPPVEGIGFDTTYHFEYLTEAEYEANLAASQPPFSGARRFPASEADVGDGSGSGAPKTCPTNNPPTCEVEQTATGLQPGAHYKVRLVATTGAAAASGPESFATTPANPSVSGTLAEEVGQTSAILRGFVNPNNQATEYHFEWGAEEGAYRNRIPAETEESAGAGGSPVKVSAELEGLKTGTAYHFRIVASNHCDPLQPNEVCVTDGPDQEFTTLSLFGLPDSRAPEQVSPVDKRPVGLVGHVLLRQMTYQAAADGEGVIYPLLNGLPDSTAGGELEYLAKRGATGWLSSQVTPPALIPPPHGGDNATGAVRYSSPDLSCQLVESFEPLTADTPAEDVEEGNANLYLRDQDGAYTLLSTPVPHNGSEIGSANTLYHVDGASNDCHHVLFDTPYKLLAGKSGLFEWEEGGALRPAGVLPDGSPASGALAGAGSLRTNLNSISADGSRVFFSATSDAGGDSGHTAVFVRKGGTETVDASQSKTATANGGDSNYQMASADGSHVLFTARYGLAANGTSAGATGCAGSGTGCDLYSYDVAAGTLADLSADANPADEKGADVVGVLDASTDGADVYFAARGQLVPGQGKTEAQNLQAATYSVYLSHDGALSYVGPVSEADIDGGFSGTDLVTGPQAIWVADATPDGRHLLFVSKANVTDYDSGGVAEVYLYSAASGQVACVSCRADGQPSEGNVNTRPIATQIRDNELIGAVAQNRPRSLSDDGSRVFFTMPDALAPGAKSDTRNIYEWEQGQVYLLVAGEGGGARDLNEFADSSADGDDAFVVTKEKLAPRDFDNTTDLYDLRAPHVPGEEIDPPKAEPAVEACEPLADKCQGAAAPQPAAAPNAPSESFSGPGNQPTPPPKKPGHKKKAHKRAHKKKAHKEKKAHKAKSKRAADKSRRASR